MTNIQPWTAPIVEAERKFTEIAAATGGLVTYQREAMFALQSIGDKEALQKCAPASIRNAVINVASVGLSLSPALKLAYLVPRDGKCCLDISYIGLVKIATDSGSVHAVKAVIVCQNDAFEYVDPFTTPRHKFDPFASSADRGDVIGVYVIAKLANGITQIETLSREEINKIRSVSKAKSGPWDYWFEEMVKKAAIKRASKLWPRTDRLSTAEEIINQHEGNDTQLQPLTIDADTGAVDGARDAYDAAQERAERLVAAAKAATTPEELKAAWSTGLKEAKAANDMPAYNALKAAVEERGKAFKKELAGEAMPG